MRNILFIISLLLTVPVLVTAQGLQNYIPSIVDFVSDVLIPFLLGIAFLIVVFNTVRYFVVGSTNEQGRETAKAYIMYSIFAFVFILTFFGIINILGMTTDLDRVEDTQHRPQTDFEDVFGT
jgi:uncharacterized membrane protein